MSILQAAPFEFAILSLLLFNDLVTALAFIWHNSIQTGITYFCILILRFSTAFLDLLASESTIELNIFHNCFTATYFLLQEALFTALLKLI